MSIFDMMIHLSPGGMLFGAPRCKEFFLFEAPCHSARTLPCSSSFFLLHSLLQGMQYSTAVWLSAAVAALILTLTLTLLLLLSDHGEG